MTVINGYVDSDFATDPTNRRSVTGYLVTIGESLVSWKSKQQASATLSSTEAEYVAMSQCATEMVFIRNLLRDMKYGDVKMVMHEDNAGALFLAKNMAVGQRTKHVDTRCHYVRELVERKELEVRYINTRNNPADLLTKNLGAGNFRRLADAIGNAKFSLLEEGGCSGTVFPQGGKRLSEIWRKNEKNKSNRVEKLMSM
ncbi:MAG: Ty1/Copia family ribonuclease HI [Pseudomonadota bacterium]